MTLTEQLKVYADTSKKRHPGESQKIMKSAIDQLVETDIINKAFKIGNQVPRIELPNATGTLVNLQSILKNNKVVLVFYRGGWCPYCNLELKAFQNALPQIEAKGAKLVAISPQTPDHSLNTQEKNALSFEVLSDMDNQVARSMNLVYQLPDALIALYKTFGIHLDASNANEKRELPIAATYIIEQNGEISYHYVAEDYKLRADPEAILEAL